MTKKALLALCIAILIPVVGYLILSYESNKAIEMPRRYLLDSVTTKVKDGKLITDSIWHKTANITLVNQLGDTVSLYDLKGKVIVADFFFTSCGSICPTLTRNMAKMQQSFLKGGDEFHRNDSLFVQFLSFTIDPEHDSVPKLRAYAEKYGANNDNWWFLTGPKDTIYNFIFEQLKVDKYSDEPIDPNFVHTGRFVLFDKDYVVRGYYDGTDSSSLKQLARDIGYLIVEKPSTPRPLPFSPLQMAIFFMIGCTIVVTVTGLIFKKKKKQTQPV
ncbi:MAG: SCO family protein [Ilyomonas sp.]